MKLGLNLPIIPIPTFDAVKAWESVIIGPCLTLKFKKKKRNNQFFLPVHRSILLRTEGDPHSCHIRSSWFASDDPMRMGRRIKISPRTQLDRG